MNVNPGLFKTTKIRSNFIKCIFNCQTILQQNNHVWECLKNKDNANARKHDCQYINKTVNYLFTTNLMGWF